MITFKSILQEVYEYDEMFINGGCVDFCFALNKVYGYSIFGVVINYEEYDNGEIIHSFCVDNGMGIDVKGKRSIDEIMDDFSDITEDPYYGEFTMAGFTQKLKETKFKRDVGLYNESLQIIQANIDVFR